jgi:outer membrane murein-binding lipoprotein Lpp
MILDSAGLARVTGGAASVTGNPLGTGNTVEFNTGLLTLAFSGTGGSSIWDIANCYSVVLGFPGTLVNNLYFYGDSSGFPAAQIWDQPASGTRGISALNVIANTLSTSNIIGNPTFSGNPLFTGNIGLQQGTAGTTLWNVNVGSASGPASYSFNNALVFSANGVPCLAMVGVTPTGSAVWAYSQLGALEVDCGEMNVRDPSTWNSVVHIDSSGNITAAGDINSPTINDIYTQIVNLQEEIDALGSDSESVQSQVISDQNLNAKDAEIQKLKSQNASFEKRLAALEALVKASAHK